MPAPQLICPACKATSLNIRDYDSMMVLGRGMALFTVRCPRCGTSASIVHAIPPCLREEVDFAAIELGAGMGREG